MDDSNVDLDGNHLVKPNICERNSKAWLTALQLPFKYSLIYSTDPSPSDLLGYPRVKSGTQETLPKN